LSDLILEAFPVFSAPIYIGKAKNLRNRLIEHATTFRKYHDAIAREPHRREELLEHLRKQDPDFGARAAVLNFGADELKVIPWQIQDSVSVDLTEAEQEDIATALEWLLNRWYRPICGRL
jgi:hypothetical protein